MSKNTKKVNPYEKKKKRGLKITRQQWIAILSLVAVIAIIAGIVVVARQANKNSNGHYEGDGHNHDITPTTGNGHYEGDGHNHGTTPTTGNGHYEGDGHNHGTTPTTGTDKVKYQLYTNADKTYHLIFRDNNGKPVAEFDKIAKQPAKVAINADKGVYELGWATGTGPNDYECIYYNVKTGQVSALFKAPRGTDGVRIAYGSEDQTKVIVQDLFNKKAYYSEYALTNPAPNKNGDTIVGGVLKDDKKTVVISYLSKDADESQHAVVKLYE